MAVERGALTPVMSIDDMLAMRKNTREFVSRVFAEKVDFSRIQGVADRAVLLKPGAEKLVAYFGLEVMPPELIGSQEDWTGDDSKVGRPLFYYVIRQTLSKGGVVIASQCGSCSSEEKRYRLRLRNRVCPHCRKEEVRRSTFQDNNEEPGWYCWAKMGGCGSKFRFDDPVIAQQNADPVLNENPADVANTILKMAEKRAFVGAVLIATGTSDIYTQDLEDAAEDSEVMGAGVPRVTGRPLPSETTGRPDDSKMREEDQITSEMLAYFDRVRVSLGRRTDVAGDDALARFLSRGQVQQKISRAADMTVKSYRYVLGHMEQYPEKWRVRDKAGVKA